MDGSGAVVSYIHMGGKVGVLLSIKAGRKKLSSLTFKALAKDLTCLPPPLPRALRQPGPYCG
ncbi:MAG: hypothetical protein ACLT8E_02065 [Akkermansia sp.]